MALSKCPKCENHYFEVIENSPSKSNYKLFFVQCSSCGCVISAMEYFNVGNKITEVENKINTLSSTVRTVNGNLDVINHNIANLQSLVQSLKTGLR